jgi:predicted amidohydrolase
MDVEIGDVEANRARIIERIKEAARSNAQLIIFPECALTGYCFESLE